MAEEDKKKKKKRPTAEKRVIQDQKKQQKNRIFKSKIRTTLRSFNDNLKEKDQEVLTKDLNSIYAMVDKAVKRNIYQANKAKRIKSRHAKQMQKVLSS
ncbi:MAG: hypothetical protein S4CHLAM6_11350 [Chlamydiae bacterium]|nr:hypothetical protein [Chlamydiota bacterium]